MSMSSINTSMLWSKLLLLSCYRHLFRVSIHPCYGQRRLKHLMCRTLRRFNTSMLRSKLLLLSCYRHLFRVSIHPCYGQRRLKHLMCRTLRRFNTSMLRSKIETGLDDSAATVFQYIHVTVKEAFSYAPTYQPPRFNTSMLRSKEEQVKEQTKLNRFQYIHVTVKGKIWRFGLLVYCVSIHPCYGQRAMGWTGLCETPSFNTSMLRSKTIRRRNGNGIKMFQYIHVTVKDG